MSKRLRLKNKTKLVIAVIALMLTFYLGSQWGSGSAPGITDNAQNRESGTTGSYVGYKVS